ncbi:hypothetical protein MO867_16775 [Microbulbifer sp. OS29]|uniref:Uncharacterized protein n=1 Tax=Microbulbifer okhotskensis TaxID=2926617 RepID=A0A9X2J8W2_9GAMM|nr:hypothetical protein [Microbulbifer okhotskensis]MCO1335986.1 hypothetical protein [Microbulbifer okhotskensis]
MVHLFLRGNVKDFNAWYKVFTEFMPKLKQMGATTTSVYREINNHRDVTVIHEFASKEDAIKYVNNPEVQEVRNQAGVLAPPQVWYTEIQ